MKPILAFITVNAFFAFIAWTCGYNFDYRDAGVGYATFCSMAMSLAVAIPIYITQ